MNLDSIDGIFGTSKSVDGNNSCQRLQSHVINMDIAVHLVSVIPTILPSLNALVSLDSNPSILVNGTLEIQPMVVPGNQGQ